MLVVLAVAAVVRLREPITARIGAFHDVLVAAAVMSLLAPGGLYLFGPPFQQMYIGAQLMVWIALLLVLLFATDAALRETSRFSTGFVTGDAMAPGRSLTAFTTTHSRWAGRAEKRNRAWRDACGIAHALFQRVVWGGRRVSNPRPPEPQSGVLPLNYAHHTDCGKASLASCSGTAVAYKTVEVPVSTLTIGILVALALALALLVPYLVKEIRKRKGRARPPHPNGPQRASARSTRQPRAGPSRSPGRSGPSTGSAIAAGGRWRTSAYHCARRRETSSWNTHAAAPAPASINSMKPTAISEHRRNSRNPSLVGWRWGQVQLVRRRRNQRLVDQPG